MFCIQILDPSGEKREVQLDHHKLQDDSPIYRIGKSRICEIQLNDPLVPDLCAELIFLGSDGKEISQNSKSPIPSPPLGISDSTIILKSTQDSLWLDLSGLKIKNAQWDLDLPVSIGGSKLILTRRSGLISNRNSELTAAPNFPSGYQTWETFEKISRDLLWSIKKVAQTHLAVYLGGETGTGKEVLAHLLHGWSERASGPFVAINCAALPLGLAESELFGHVKGAFTGAVQSRPGAFLQAHGGTVFLDEVADLSPEIQVKLLRFLENGEMRAVGSDRQTRSDVRVVCATHKPLLQLVEDGKFRKDLYYRIASIPVHIPPLRERPQDIKGLSEYFAKQLHKALSPKAKIKLCSYSWPGNVRELRHAIDRASGVAGAFKSLLNEDDFEFLGSEILEALRAPFSGGPGSQKHRAFANSNGNELLDRPILKLSEMEKLLLLKALKISNGHRGEAAKMMGVARSTLFEMLKRHKIRGPRQFRQQYYTEENSLGL